jgi:pyridoxal phosphate enzyme (YggS family)
MNSELEKSLALRLDEVYERIALAAGRVGRDPDDIKLVAVTKTWPAEVVVAAHRAGIRHIGENRAEELARKKAQVIEMLPDAGDLIWHQIGTLQSRKTRLVAENADVFHALDRLKIARRLSQQLGDLDRSLPVLLEVNLSGELSKSGFLANKWEEDATQRESLRNVIETIAQLQGLDLQGLMTMAPWGIQEDLIRSIFRRTRLLAEWLQNELPQVTLDQLSMGMTDDFEIAVEEGATNVRVGRAIFGSRHQT